MRISLAALLARVVPVGFLLACSQAASSPVADGGAPPALSDASADAPLPTACPPSPPSGACVFDPSVECAYDANGLVEPPPTCSLNYYFCIQGTWVRLHDDPGSSPQCPRSEPPDASTGKDAALSDAHDDGATDAGGADAMATDGGGGDH